MIEYVCDCCNYTTKHKSKYTRHVSSIRHTNKSKGDAEPCITEFKYSCEACKYGTHVASTYATHCKTSKHVELMGETDFQCECGMYVSSSRALTFHKRNCDFIVSNAEEPINGLSNDDDTTNVSIHEMVASKVNEEIGSKLTELTDTLKALVQNQGNTYNNNTTNTTNNQININLFITEECKDAMNLSEFAESIQVLRKDIDELLITGNPDKAAQIISRELDKLSVKERPIHCTDLKRNVMYVKDDGVWSKEGSEEKLNGVVWKTFCKQAGVFRELMDERKPGGPTEYYCDRAKHIDRGILESKLSRKYIMARVHNIICDSAILNQSVANDTLKLS